MYYVYVCMYSNKVKTNLNIQLSTNIISKNIIYVIECYPFEQYKMM